MDPVRLFGSAVRNLDDRRLSRYWDWKVRFYYGAGVKPPKVPGELAIETIHMGTSSRDLEISVGKGREDIGRIEVFDLVGLTMEVIRD